MGKIKQYKEDELVGECYFVRAAGVREFKNGTRAISVFRCKCGVEFIAVNRDVETCHKTSCGCYIGFYEKRRRPSKYDENGNVRLEYQSWVSVKQRCYNKNNPSYVNYGGRGIKMCERWLESFANFFEDMGQKPTPNHSLDRFPNNDGDYELSNCRWGTVEQQARNKRSNIVVAYNGEILCATEWDKRHGLKRGTVARRLKMGFNTDYLFAKNSFNTGNRVDTKIPRYRLTINFSEPVLGQKLYSITTAESERQM